MHTAKNIMWGMLAFLLVISTAQALSYYTIYNPFTGKLDYYALYGAGDNSTFENITVFHICDNVTGNCYTPETLSSYVEQDPIWHGNSTLVVFTSATSNWDKDDSNDFIHIDNLTGSKTDTKICTWDNTNEIINCTYSDVAGGGTSKAGTAPWLSNDTSNMIFNATHAFSLFQNISGTSGWDKDDSNDHTNASNFTGTMTDTKICIWDEGNWLINCSYTDQEGVTTEQDPIWHGNSTFYLNSTQSFDLFPNRSTWTTIDDYPANCTGDLWAKGIGDTLYCVQPNYTTNSSLNATFIPGIINESNHSIYSDNATRASILHTGSIYVDADIDKEHIETDLNTFVDIGGDTMTGNLSADTNSSYDLGNSSIWWRSAWIDTIYLLGVSLFDTFIELTDTFGGDVTGTYDALEVVDSSHLHHARNITDTLNDTQISDNITIDSTFNATVSNFTAKEGNITAGSNGYDGMLNLYSEQGANDYFVKLQPHNVMTENTLYVLPASVDEGLLGTPVLTWSSVVGSRVNLNWGSIPAPVVYLVFTDLVPDFGNNVVADDSTDILTLTSLNQTIRVRGKQLADTIEFDINQSATLNWSGQHNFTHPNTTMTHAMEEPSRAIDGTEYHNTDLRQRMVYGSVQFIVAATSGAYCEAFTDSAATPTTRHQIFGPASWVPAISQTRVDVHNFFFVVEINDYYHINCTTSGGGSATLLEWIEVVL